MWFGFQDIFPYEHNLILISTRTGKISDLICQFILIHQHLSFEHAPLPYFILNSEQLEKRINLTEENDVMKTDTNFPDNIPNSSK